jgi:hypothetical protein
MYVKEHCEPKEGDIEGSESCLSKDLLVKIANILNDKTDSTINIKSGLKELHTEISNVIKENTNCSNEACWTTYDLIKKNLSSDDFNEVISKFRPFLPEQWYEEPNKWLNTLDIDNVMGQYEKNYKGFKYTGATPIDFDLKTNDDVCLVNELCNVDLQEIINDKKKCIGMVFNTDPHNKSGQHWFSMFVDISGDNRKDKVPSIYHFDSVASDPPKRILKLIENIKDQGDKLDIKFDVLFNDIRHQYKDTECGVYCLHFLVSMLTGGKFDDYIKNKLNDDEMEKFRKVFFVPLKEKDVEKEK